MQIKEFEHQFEKAIKQIDDRDQEIIDLKMQT